MNRCFSVPGSCGEIVQGTIDGRNLHVTCPINRYSYAIAKEIKPANTEIKIKKPDSIRGSSHNISKALKALNAFRKKIGVSRGVDVEIKSDLAVGKGMASSTADIASSLYAAAEAFKTDINVSEIAEIASGIEPTDGILFEGIVLFDHIKGGYLENIGATPPIEIIVLEPARTIDTVLFNKSRQLKDLPNNEMPVVNEIVIREALEMVREGISSVDLELIGKAASLSARHNQQVLFKPELEDIIGVSARKGGLGVNVAHSGTVIGIMVESGYAERVYERINHYIPGNWSTYIVSMVSGGMRCSDNKVGGFC